jgi:hypothetical protein
MVWRPFFLTVDQAKEEAAQSEISDEVAHLNNVLFVREEESLSNLS